MIIPFHKSAIPEANLAFQHCSTGAVNCMAESGECLQALQHYFGSSSVFLTNSCGSALEVAVRGINLQPGDEVIIPGFGYVAVANAVLLGGGIPVFADVCLADGNIDVNSIEKNLSANTKAIIAIHYAGRPCALNAITALCKQHNLFLIEDAAQAYGTYYENKPLGTFGHIGCISFDYMKNITCGQGGALVVNDPTLSNIINAILDNGTNRRALIAGNSIKFDWVTKGSNYQINPLASHLLYSQLKLADSIINNRLSAWNTFYRHLLPLHVQGSILLPNNNIEHNGHIFYILTKSETERAKLRAYMRTKDIYCEPHYSFLPETSVGRNLPAAKGELTNATFFANCLLRLPMWNGISTKEVLTVAHSIADFYTNS